MLRGNIIVLFPAAFYPHKDIEMQLFLYLYIPLLPYITCYYHLL